MTPNPDPDRLLIQQLESRARYLDAFGPTDDGALMQQAAVHLATNRALHVALVAALRQITGDQFPAVLAGIRQGIADATGAAHG